MNIEQAHRVAREQGVSRFLYRLVRLTTQLVFRVLCGFTSTGVKRVPKQGAVVIVPNHKSFWDPFFIAMVVRRPVHFMGKAEHFDGPMATTFLRLGAFPVRRGASDEEALETARQILSRGDALALFPEGTRVREEGLGTPKRGAARLAIEAGAPLVPATITGTEKRRWPLPRHVHVTFGDPVSVEGLQATPEDAASAIHAAWPHVTETYTKWQNRPSTYVAAATALGLAGWLVRKRRH